MSPCMVAFCELLADGQWHPIGELINIAEIHIDPDRAYQRGIRTLHPDHTKRQWWRTRTREQYIRSGQRHWTHNLINVHTKKGRFEKDPIKGVRLKP